MKYNLFILLAMLMLGINACIYESENGPATIITSDFSVTIDENPAEGQILGTISATSSIGTIAYSITTESSPGAFAIDSATGELSVANKFLFDYETSPILTAGITLNDNVSSTTTNVTVNLNNLEFIWSGPKIIFYKSAYADINLEQNQDRITENVWITRANNAPLINVLGGSGCEPTRVKMAYGTITELGSLTFSDCMEKLEGSNLKELPDKDVVFYLTADDIYIDVHFITWTSGSNGGEFSYERSTP